MTAIIKEVEWGVANTYKEGNDSIIEINSKLKEFPELREKILDHELNHAKNNGFWKQRKVDMKTKIKHRDLFKFYKKYPKTFLQQNIPVNYSKEKNTLYIEWSRIFLIIIYVGILFGIYLLINLFSTSSVFFWEVIKYMGIILGVYFILHFSGKRLRKYINKEATESVKNKNK